MMRLFSAAGLLAYTGIAVPAAAAAEGPCDILQAAGNPCVAAHSTTRALYSGYDGGLCVLTQFLWTFSLQPSGVASKTAVLVWPAA